MSLNCVDPFISRFFSTNMAKVWLNSQRQNQGYRRLAIGLQHLWILVFAAGPGTNPPQIPRSNCIYAVEYYSVMRKKDILPFAINTGRP